MATMRLQRFLAQAGVASRRKAEELILAGRVRINGKVIRELGSKVDTLKDRVDFDNRRIQAEDHVWLLLNKPDGTVCTVDDPEKRTTVLDVLGPQTQRLYPVGRLDYHTMGALLLTNDGELANALAHPRNQIPRIYEVKVRGLVSPDRLDELREGVTLEDGTRVKAQARMLGTTDNHTWVEVILHQGLNRQIHRMMLAIDLEVLKLIRVSFAELTVQGLRPGQHRNLTQREVTELRNLVNLQGETVRAAKRSAKKPGRGRDAMSRKKAPPRRRAPAKPRAKQETSTGTTKTSGQKPPATKEAPAKKTPPKKAPRPEKQRTRKHAGKKPATNKPAGKKPATKKPATRKPAAKKAPSRKAPAKRAPTEKPAARKPAARKPAARKPAAKRQTGKPSGRSR